MDTNIVTDYIVPLLDVFVSWPVAVVVIVYWFRVPLLDTWKE